MKTANCRTCRAPIVWARTTTGKTMPVDPAPTNTGNVVLEDRGDWTPPDAVVIGPLEAANHDGALHLSHFVTCPQADDHRKATGQ